VVRVRYTTFGGCSEYNDSIEIRESKQPQGIIGTSDTLEFCESALIHLTGTNIDSVEWNAGTIVDDSTIEISASGLYNATLFSRDGCSSVTNTVVAIRRSPTLIAPVVWSIVAPESIQPGRQFALVLRTPSTGNLDQLPALWSATIEFSSTVLFPLFETFDPIVQGATIQAKVSGSRIPLSDTLAILSFQAALGESDTATLSFEDFVFSPCNDTAPILRIPLLIEGICRENGSPRFISTRPTRIALMGNPTLFDGNPIITLGGTDSQSATVEAISLHGERYPFVQLASLPQQSQWRFNGLMPSGLYIVVVRTELDALSFPLRVVQ
jgi:hypothetical protein